MTNSWVTIESAKQRTYSPAALLAGLALPETSPAGLNQPLPINARSICIRRSHGIWASTPAPQNYQVDQVGLNSDNHSWQLRYAKQDMRHTDILHYSIAGLMQLTECSLLGHYVD